VLRAARRNWLVWFVVLPVALWALVRLLGLDSGFPVVALMAFTPYVAVAALLVAGIAVALENWVATAVAALATLCLAAAVLPRTIGDGTVEAAGRETIGVLSINAHFGGADAAAAVALVKRLDPDVLSVQELTPEFAAKLERHGIGEQLPNTVLSVVSGAPGTGIYSTLPLTELSEGQDFGFRMPRARAELPGGGALRIVAIHPYTPTRNGIGKWEAALADLPASGRGVPWLLVGDFNATLDHAALRDVLDRGYRDAAAVAGEGLEPTWPTGRWADLPGVTIDHVIFDRRFDVVEYAVADLPNTDHRPVYARLALP
jgi:endonuclease/exonuclease/phosphatase (EEP) superfamily protein YafD